MSEIFVITGPTCSGKTARALKLAREINAEIISCDSVQVYRGMNIGAAKASADELRSVRHHLIDVADVSEKFDVSQYVELARAALADIESRNKRAIVCGGSGFYLRAWFGPVIDSVQIPPEVAALCDDLESDGGLKALSDALLKIDPDAAQSLDIQNPRRVKNALRRCMASGKTCARLLEDFSKLPSPMGELKKNVEILDLPDSQIAENIKIRTENMLRSGLVEETKRLVDCGIKSNPSASSAVGYRETLNWLERGDSDESALIAEIEKNTIALVKKQRKYFRNTLLK